jgi:hypothetical protein
MPLNLEAFKGMGVVPYSGANKFFGGFVMWKKSEIVSLAIAALLPPTEAFASEQSAGRADGIRHEDAGPWAYDKRRGGRYV